MSDQEIAKDIELKHISTIAEKLGLNVDDIEMYGKYKAKLPQSIINHENIKKSNLILVTAISPTPAGEGKTTMSIGLSEGLNQLGKQTTVVLREPSLGPVFGIKGGATGGGYSQVLPMEDINLHFTGDFSAIEKANNLCSVVYLNVPRLCSIHSVPARGAGGDPPRLGMVKLMNVGRRLNPLFRMGRELKTHFFFLTSPPTTINYEPKQALIGKF